MKINKITKICFIVSAMLISTLFCGSYVNAAQESNLANAENNYIYLSDIDYTDIEKYTSYTGWANIEKNKNPDGNTIKIRKDGEIVSYQKGMGFHAPGQLVYDISKYSSTYTRFIAKVGVDASKPDVSSLTVEFLVSNNGAKWESLYKTDTLSSTMNAVEIDLKVGGYHYLRIYTDPVGGNASDHCVLADAKLATETYDSSSELYSKIQPLEEYDNRLRQNTADQNYTNHSRLILEREFVRKCGYWNLQNIASTDPISLEAIEWILSDDTVLERVIEVGEIADANRFLNALGTLYNQYKDTLKTDVNGDVYQRMMIGLAAAYSTDNISSPLTFSFQKPNYDVVERFDLMKQLLLEGKFVRENQFKSLRVELMRMVMQDALRSDETIWFNAYTRTKGEHMLDCGYYLNYISPNYNRDEAFDPARKAQYDEKYKLSEYDVPYADGRTQRYWMVLEFGGICWNISRTGQTTHKVNGVPAVGVYQPGHEAFVYYDENEQGQGIWKMQNNIGGWGAACTKWYGGNRYRLLLDWGNKDFSDQVMSGTTKGTSSGYILLAQANLNQYEAFQKSSYYNLMANSYTDNATKLSIYHKALEISAINLDTYDAILKVYQSMGDSVTEAQWFELADKIINAYTFYPNAMYDLLNVIKPHLTEGKLAEIEMKELNALERASNATAEDSIQVDEIKNIARALLGKEKAPIATFSFDGEQAGEIVIGEQYAIKWSYSIDGGQTYSSKTTNRVMKLSEAELKAISDETDIKIAIEGTDMIFTIDIMKSSLPQTDGHAYLYANDLENRVVGIDTTMEWCYEGEDKWTSYEKESPILTGNQTVYVRVGYTKNYIPSDYETFKFTAEEEANPNRTYIPVSHLSIKEVSTEAVSNGGRASNSIDGNYNTRWHSAWNGSDTQRYIIIEIDKAVYLSAVEFVPAGGGNGRIINGTVYGSMDGTSWKKLSALENLEYDAKHQNDYDFGLNHVKEFTIEKPQQVKYVKIVADKASGGNGNWFAARMFNFYQDITYDIHPTAGIGYSTTKPTRENVIARLVNLSPENAKITSRENSDTYVFTQNGEFTFTFEDALGRKGSATAIVDWIDREIKKADIEFSTTNLTNGSVVATLKPNEEIMIINDGNYTVNEYGKLVKSDGTIIEDFRMDDECDVISDEEEVLASISNFKYEFFTNGSYTFYYVDRAGNVGSTTATVDWIDNTPPEAVLTYDITHITNKDVTVTLDFNEENVVVKNNNGKASYTFEKNEQFTFDIEDAAGNPNEVTATVHWIDKEAPTATIEYSTTDATQDIVTATITNPSEEITVVNNNHIDSYTFTSNDRFKFVIQDNAGNQTEVLAEVNWISLDSEADITSEEYQIDTDRFFIKKVARNTLIKEFANHLTSTRGFAIRDKNQESILDTRKNGNWNKSLCRFKSIYGNCNC